MIYILPFLLDCSAFDENKHRVKPSKESELSSDAGYVGEKSKSNATKKQKSAVLEEDSDDDFQGTKEESDEEEAPPGE